MGGPDVQHRGGQSIFLHTLMDIYFFFAGATAPPRDNVAPPLYINLPTQPSPSYESDMSCLVIGFNMCGRVTLCLVIGFTT